MKNQSENDFKSKFCLLNSQEHHEEIIWSCSDSSDYENPLQNKNLEKARNTVIRKRKRMKTRKKQMKNVSNLDITFVDASLETTNEINNDIPQYLQKNINIALSPILTDSQVHFAPLNTIKTVPESPILSCSSKNYNSKKNVPSNSPIILFKHAKSKVSPNIKKKLFTNNNEIDVEPPSDKISRSKSPVLKCSQINKKLRSNSNVTKRKTVEPIFDTSNGHNCSIQHKYFKSIAVYQDLVEKSEIELKNQRQLDNPLNIKREVNTADKNILDDTLAVKTSSALIEKVKSYFDNHFSSDTPSQSISEYDTTPKNSSKTSGEIELISSLTDTKNVPSNVKVENTSSSNSLKSSQEEYQVETSKNVKYKKGGLAHRLNVLLKKQKANICLWQHERFLAANSNFVLPAEDYTAFRIQNITFKYGCYLLDTTDIEDKKIIILINQLYINNIIIDKDMILKLYKPFKIIEFDRDYKLIVNVCKFECTRLSDVLDRKGKSD